MTIGCRLGDAKWGPVVWIPTVKRALGVAANVRKVRDEITPEDIAADDRRDKRKRTAPQPFKQTKSLR